MRRLLRKLLGSDYQQLYLDRFSVEERIEGSYGEKSGETTNLMGVWGPHPKCIFFFVDLSVSS
jgi:hypothetical protein